MSWKTPITLLVLIGLLLGAAYYGWQTIVSPATNSKDKAARALAHACTKKRPHHRGQQIASTDVLVNVYNAGAVTGLAAETLTALHRHGFVEGVADNSPVAVAATNVTILTRDKRLPPVQLVAMQFKGRVAFRKGPALAPGVDVVVGDGYVGLNPAARTVLRFDHRVRACASRKRRSH